MYWIAEEGNANENVLKRLYEMVAIMCMNHNRWNRWEKEKYKDG